MEMKLNPDGSIQPQANGGSASPEPQNDQPRLYVEPGVGDTPAAPGPTPGDVIKDSDTPGFKRDVIDESMNQPVIVDFWAPWCGPCKQLGPALEKLVRQAGGLVKMVKINVDENQELAAQMRIQSIPAVYAFNQGQPVDGFMGALPESQLKTFIDRLLGGAKPPLEAALEDAQAALDSGDTETARAIFDEIQTNDPGNPTAIGGLIRAALAAGDREGAQSMIDGLPDELKAKPEIAQAVSAVEVAGLADGAADLDDMTSRIDADPNDHQARLDLAKALCGMGRNQEGVEHLLELIRRDRNWNDEAGRKQLLTVFEALGPSDPVTQDGRRQLSSILFS